MTSTYSSDHHYSNYNTPHFTKRSKTSPSNLFTFTPLPSVVQRHLHQVYLQLFLLCFTASLGAYLQTQIPILQGRWSLMFLSLGILFAFSRIPPHPHNFNKRRNILATFAFVQGLALGPIINLALETGGSTLVFAACVASASIFGGLAVASMFTRRRGWLYLEGTLLGSLMGMMVISWFAGYELAFNVLVYGGLLMFCGFVLYDSQLIVELAADGERDVLAHALILFEDLIAIFRRVLIIMIKNQMKKDGKKEKNKK